jgi:hypothetical protein
MLLWLSRGLVRACVGGSGLGAAGAGHDRDGPCRSVSGLPRCAAGRERKSGPCRGCAALRRCRTAARMNPGSRSSRGRDRASRGLSPRGGGFRALMRCHRLRAYIRKRDTGAGWAVVRDFATLGNMRSAHRTHATACPSCRGYGWKVRRSRRTPVTGTIVRGTAEPVRLSCPDCGGTGRAAGAQP